jgi:hypothetical protein
VIPNMLWFANILLNLCVCVRGPPTTSTTHNHHNQLVGWVWWPVVVLGCLRRAKFQVRHIFSIKINMGTVQQYGVGEGEVFSILDL